MQCNIMQFKIVLLIFKVGKDYYYLLYDSKIFN